jgi:hypothetical protein
MRNDCPRGYDRSFLELHSRKVLGFGFGLKCLGRPRASLSDRCSSPRDFKGHIPSMVHPMIQAVLLPSISRRRGFACSRIASRRGSRRPISSPVKDCVASLSRQIFISGTLSGMNRSASVTAMTSATVTPGAVSCSVILPPGKPITAISVTTKSTGRKEVSGRAHFWTIFD